MRTEYLHFERDWPTINIISWIERYQVISRSKKSDLHLVWIYLVTHSCSCSTDRYEIKQDRFQVSLRAFAHKFLLISTVDKNEIVSAWDVPFSKFVVPCCFLLARQLKLPINVRDKNTELRKPMCSSYEKFSWGMSHSCDILGTISHQDAL